MIGKYLLALAACLLAMPLAACEAAVDQCVKAANPTECRQVAQAGGDVSDYLAYGMAGYMLSTALNGSGQRQPVIIADPHYSGPRRSIASYQASPSYVRRQTVTSSSRAGPSSTKTVATSMRGYTAPASYRSSFSSFRAR